MLQGIAYPAVKQLTQKITDVEQIFVIGEGCSGLDIRMAAMRSNAFGLPSLGMYRWLILSLTAYLIAHWTYLLTQSY